MVRIVSQPVVKQTTCTQCKCILEYSYSETRTDISYDYTGGSDEYRYIKCPVCDYQLTVPFHF